mgnify:CR=1 FL=1
MIQMIFSYLLYQECIMYSDLLDSIAVSSYNLNLESFSNSLQ